MKICSKCGKSWNTNNRFCTECGGTLVDASPNDGKIICPNCGQPTDGKMSFCSKCGNRLAQPTPQQPEVNPKTPPYRPDPLPPQPPVQESKNNVAIWITTAIIGTVLIVVLVLLLCLGTGSCGGKNGGDVAPQPQEKVYHWDGDYLKDQDGVVILHITDIPDRAGTYVDSAGNLRDADGTILMDADRYRRYVEDSKKESTYQAYKSNDTWYDARAKAYQMNGYLVSINDYEEFTKVCAMAEEAGMVAFWAGARRDSFQSWYDTNWEDGSDFTYTNWLEGEPSGTTEEGDEELYLLVFKVKGAWYYNDAPNSVDEFYSGKMGYIVEIEE